MQATSMCLVERAVYTQEVLAVVIQQLMDHQPLPTLLMRTVLQALSLYPKLSGFVMNILSVFITIFKLFSSSFTRMRLVLPCLTLRALLHVICQV